MRGRRQQDVTDYERANWARSGPVTSLTPLEAIHACHDQAQPGAAHCVVDDGQVNPPWLREGERYWWWDEPAGTLEVAGLSIPLTRRWLLCPAHAILAVRDMAERVSSYYPERGAS